MTPEQKTELEYLIDLLREASKWNVDQGDDALRLEVDLRIENILNPEESEETEEAAEESEPDPGATDDYIEKRNRNREAKAKYNKNNVRVFTDGKPVWRPRNECHQELRFPDKPGCDSFKWVWDGPQDKQAQMDSMWEQHEAGNA